VLSTHGVYRMRKYQDDQSYEDRRRGMDDAKTREFEEGDVFVYRKWKIRGMVEE